MSLTNPCPENVLPNLPIMDMTRCQSNLASRTIAHQNPVHHAIRTAIKAATARGASMTDPLRKAAGMALERLESHEYWMDEDAIQALRQALAQPEQEPLAWINKNEVANIKAMAKAKCTKEWQTNLGLEPEVDDVPLYTAPPKRELVGLTKEDIKEGVNASRLYEDQFEPVALWVEAKLKEKNT